MTKKAADPSNEGRGKRIANVREQFLRGPSGKVMPQAELAQKIGVSRGAVTNWERGGKIHWEHLRAISELAGVDFSWLMTGPGTTPPPAAVQPRAVPIEDDGFEPPFVENGDEMQAAERFEKRRLEPGEVVEREVAAGLGIGGHSTVITVDGQEVDEVRAVWRLPPEYLHSELRSREADVDLISVDGDSMVPTLTPGDRVLINRRHARPGDGLFAIHDGFGVSVKRLEIVQGASPPRIIIKSDNEHHGNHEVLAEDLVVIGRVVCRITRL